MGILSEILPRKGSMVRIISLGSRSYTTVNVFQGRHHTAMDMRCGMPKEGGVCGRSICVWGVCMRISISLRCSLDGKLVVLGNAIGEVAVVSVEERCVVMPVR